MAEPWTDARRSARPGPAAGMPARQRCGRQQGARRARGPTRVAHGAMPAARRTGRELRTPCAGGTRSARARRPRPARPRLRRRRHRGGLRAARQRQVHADPAGRDAARAIDSQDTRDRWARRAAPLTAVRPLPPAGPRSPTTRALRRALRSGASRGRPRLRYAGLGTPLARPRRRAAGAAPCTCSCSTSTPRTARQGQRERGRGVSGYAFARHRSAVARLLARRRAGHAARRAAPRRCCWTGRRRARSPDLVQRRGRPRPPAPVRVLAERRQPGDDSLRRGSRGSGHSGTGPGAPPARVARQRARRGARRLARRRRRGRPARRGARPQLGLGAAAGRRRPAQRRPRPAHDGHRRAGVRPRLQLRGAVPQLRRQPHVLRRGPRPRVRPRAAPAGRHRGEPGRRGRHPAAAARRRRALPGRAHRRWTGPPAAAGCGCTSRTGRTTRWTSSPPPPPSSRPPAWCSTARRGARQHRGRRPRPLRRRRVRHLGRRGRRAPRWTPWAGRSAGSRSPWPVNLVLLDVAQDPVGDWMRERVRPFYQREGH